MSNQRLLSVLPDHVAVAVPDLAAAGARWGDQLGGALVTWVHNHGFFRTRQYRYPSGAKIELLAPSEEAPDRDANFVQRYLDNYGPRVHHVTLKVPDLLAAVRTVEAAGYDVVDINTSDDWWKEAFLRPSQVGGMIVQLAQTMIVDEEVAAHRGYTIPDNPPGASDLVGPLLGHPEPERSAALWAVLGARIVEDATGFVASWAGSALTVRVQAEDRAGPIGLRFHDAAPLPPDAVFGAAVLPA